MVIWFQILVIETNDSVLKNNVQSTTNCDWDQLSIVLPKVGDELNWAVQSPTHHAHINKTTLHVFSYSHIQLLLCLACPFPNSYYWFHTCR